MAKRTGTLLDFNFTGSKAKKAKESDHADSDKEADQFVEDYDDHVAVSDSESESEVSEVEPTSSSSSTRDKGHGDIDKKKKPGGTCGGT